MQDNISSIPSEDGRPIVDSRVTAWPWYILLVQFGQIVFFLLMYSQVSQVTIVRLE